MSRYTVTVCDAPDCGNRVQDEIPRSWWRADVTIGHGPFAFIVDHANEVIASRAFYACSPEHVLPALAHAFAEALNARPVPS